MKRIKVRKHKWFIQYVMPVSLCTASVFAGIIASPANYMNESISKGREKEAQIKKVNNFYKTFNFNRQVDQSNLQTNKEIITPVESIEKAQNFSIQLIQEEWTKDQLQEKLSETVNKQINIDECVDNAKKIVESRTSPKDQPIEVKQQGYSFSLQTSSLFTTIATLEQYTDSINKTAGEFIVEASISAGLAAFYFLTLNFSSGIMATAASATSLITAGILYGAGGNIRGTVIGSEKFGRDYQVHKKDNDALKWPVNYRSHVRYWTQVICETEKAADFLGTIFLTVGLIHSSVKMFKSIGKMHPIDEAMQCFDIAKGLMDVIKQVDDRTKNNENEKPNISNLY